MCIYSANARWRGRRDKAVACAILSPLIWDRHKILWRQRTLQKTRSSYSRTSAQSIPTMRFSAKRLSDFGKIRKRASLVSLNPTIPRSVPLWLFKIVITWLLLICDWRWRSAEGFCHSVWTRGLPQLSIIWEKRAVLVLSSFICEWLGLPDGVTRFDTKSPPENYGKEDHTTVAAFLPWRGLQVLNP